MNTLDYNSIGQRAHATAQEKGWYDDGGPDFGTRVALIHSEVSEALEAYRKDKWSFPGVAELYLSNPELVDWDSRIKGTVGDELADVVIRCCESLAHFGVDANALKASAPKDNLEGKSFGFCLSRLHRGISWAGITTSDNNAKLFIKGCAMYAELIAAKFNIDLPAHIEAKLRYNTTRPHKHGGKKF